MKAVGVRPGFMNSAALLELPMPSLDEVPDGQGVLVRVMEVGVDGTDREIHAGEYGKAPTGSEYLILGHESLGRVEAVGPKVTQLKVGDFVVAIVRRPGTSRYDVIGTPDMTTDEEYFEPGINLCHGFLTEYYVDCQDYLVRIPEGLSAVGVLTEPASIVAKGLTQAYEIQQRLLIWEPRKAAVLGAGPLGLLAAMALRLRELDVTVFARAEPPTLNATLVEAIGGQYVSGKRASLVDTAATHSPFDLIFEATGAAPLVFEAMQALAKNGVLIASGVPSRHQEATIPASAIVRELVLGNRVLVGTVNANRSHFGAAVRDLALAEVSYPGWLGRLITHRVQGLERHAELFDLLQHASDGIKVVVHV